MSARYVIRSGKVRGEGEYLWRMLWHRDGFDAVWLREDERHFARRFECRGSAECVLDGLLESARVVRLTRTRGGRK